MKRFGRRLRRRLPARASAPFLLGALIILTGCSFDYDGDTAETGEGEIPQIELYGVTMYVSRDTNLELRADHIATYQSRRIQEMESVSFREFGPDGELRVEGFADFATLNLDNENVELSGNIRFLSTVEDAEVESEYLFWNNDERVLSAQGEVVRLRRNDGSEILGTGLELDGRRNSLRFSSGVSGSYIVGEAAE